MKARQASEAGQKSGLIAGQAGQKRKIQKGKT